MTDVSRGTTDSGRICGRCSVRPAAPGQRRCTECHTEDMRARRAGMVNVLLTPDEWLAVKAARLAAAGLEHADELALHWRPAGGKLIACGADHRPYWPFGQAKSILCCTTDIGKVTCKLCRPLMTTEPKRFAISPLAAPAAAGSGAAAAVASSSTTRTPSVPGTVAPTDYLEVDRCPACVRSAAGGQGHSRSELSRYHGPPANVLEQLADRGLVELRLGGKRPGVYVEGKPVDAYPG